MMMTTKRSLMLVLGFTLVATAAQAQARLIIENQSQRQMAVKVMKQSADKDTLHQLISIAAFGTQTVFFSETGDYFTKTMAVLSGKEPVYQRGTPFRVYNGADGYTVLTVTFSITESVIPDVVGGKQISKQEFDKNESPR